MLQSSSNLSEAVAKQSGAVETRDHFKNGASSKSLMSRGNFLRKACFALLAASIIFGGCDDKTDKEEQTGIDVQNKDELTQETFAHEMFGSNVTFVTTGAWTSAIKEETTSTKAGTPSWISIAPDHGTATGEYTIVIFLDPNETGNDRTAIISITCNETDIAITVTQKATLADGRPYEPEPFDSKIEAQVFNGDAYNSVFTTVKALANIYSDGTENYFKGVEIATGSYSNGGFTLNLPETMNNQYLNKIDDELDLGAGLTFSDANAKITAIIIQGYNSAGKAIGWFEYSSSNIEGVICYVDRDVNVIGANEDFRVNIRFKRGWNLLYFEKKANKVTTQTQYAMRWYRSTEFN